jgi:hypothetical protein
MAPKPSAAARGLLFFAVCLGLFAGYRFLSSGNSPPPAVPAGSVNPGPPTASVPLRVPTNTRAAASAAEAPAPSPLTATLAAAMRLAAEDAAIREALRQDEQFQRSWKKYLERLKEYDVAFQIAQQSGSQPPPLPDPPRPKTSEPGAGDPDPEGPPLPGFN